MLETIIPKYKISFGDNSSKKHSGSTRKKDFPGFHKDFEIIYIVDGECDVTIDDMAFTMHSGDIAVFPPYSLHSATATPNTFSIVLLFKEDVLIPYQLQNSHVKALITREEQTNAGLRNNIEHIINDFIKLKDTRDFETSTVVYALNTERYTDIINQLNIIKLWTLLLSGFEQVTGDSEMHNKVRELLQYIDNNIYVKELTLETIAEKLNYTVSYTSKLFKKIVGINFKKYVLSLKIKKACNLLMNTPMPVFQIAELCGFDSQRTFNETFKKFMQLTPKEYRNKSYLQDETLLFNALTTPQLNSNESDDNQTIE